MLDDAQQFRWPAMIQISSGTTVLFFFFFWHKSDTGLPLLGPPFTSGAQRSNERHPGSVPCGSIR